jgi:FKBP-type peptidyl-prolyl cis-trans isomerase 2
MRKVKKGDSVKVHYTGTLEDGTVFDSSSGREPLEFTAGNKELIPGFEGAVLGMSPGESKTERIPSDQAYGPHLEQLVHEVDRYVLPPGINTEVGQMVQITEEDGRTSPVTITKVTEDKVTMDANHPLAGKDLLFKIELIEIT